MILDDVQPGTPGRISVANGAVQPGLGVHGLTTHRSFAAERGWSEHEVLSSCCTRSDAETHLEFSSEPHTSAREPCLDLVRLKP